MKPAVISTVPPRSALIDLQWRHSRMMTLCRTDLPRRQLDQKAKGSTRLSSQSQEHPNQATPRKGHCYYRQKSGATKNCWTLDMKCVRQVGHSRHANGILAG